MKLKFRSPKKVVGILLAVAVLGGVLWSGTGAANSPDPSPTPAESLSRWCTELRTAIHQLKWKIDPCNGIHWQIGGTSVAGRPLVYAEFGNTDLRTNTTLVFSSVHGDEVTPVYLGIELANWLKNHEAELSRAHIIVAPLVNPDGFYHRPRTRMNARGVDVNRNFLTRDWNARALLVWRTRLHRNPRRYPGPAARSEPETLFQESLIKRFRPQKLLSVHAPLNHMDYDGPTIQSLSRFPREYIRECVRLRNKLRAVSTGYFPGSLGNYAGNEMGIPTITLELPTANPRKAARYWRHFSRHIKTLIEYVVPDYASREIPPTG